jgi:SWI/SNF-related matrix-associated actin-dependent regulator of chromatin subfamily A3
MCKQGLPNMHVKMNSSHHRCICSLNQSSADMGLGKTIQAIALILSNPPAGHKYTSALEQETQKENAAPQTHTHMNIPPPTKTAVKQVKLPILQRLLMAAGISVTASKKDALVNLCMESLASGKLSVKAYYLGLTTKSLTTRTSSTTTTATNKTTLIICPVSVMSNWVEQIESHVQPGTLRVGIYHGPERESVLANLDTLDVLVASYNTVAHDYGKGDDGDDFEQAPSKKQKGVSIFHHTFHRILLDEAHMIRNSKTRVFKACFSLRAHLKWALTGTPLQNKAEDVHSLFEFLGVEPLGDPQVFRRAISQPLQQGDPVGLSRLRVMMAHVALRRNKQVANLNMPNKSVEFRAIDFPPDNAHKWIHDALFQTARCAFAATLSEGDAGALKNYSSIFESMLRIRQACCSGVLVPKARLERAEAVLQEIQGLDKPLTAAEGMVLLEKLNGTFQDESTECAVCLMDMDESECVILRSCSHVCCEPCLSKVGEVSGKCPFCRVKFSLTDMIRKSAASKAIERGDHGGSKLSGSKEELGPSPKIQALLAAIDEMNADEKGVIFSQFTGFLDEIEIFMKAEGHTFARIDGTKSALQRIDAMKRFSSIDNDGPRFMICSLHAAGTGINLTRGNHVFMMDTWWNKAVEMQAMDRVHRLSQTRSVRVVRFIMAGTIEERMVALQESKAAMGKGAMEKLKPEEARKLRIGEFRKLFELDVASSPVVEIDDR